MAVQERVVRHAVFAYVDPDGVNRMAVRGDRIRLDGDELKRAERFEAVAADEAALAEELAALAAPEPEVEGPASSPAGAQPDDDLDEDDELESTGSVDDGPEKPPLAATKDAWVDFRVQASEGRLTAEQLDGLTKQQLQDDAHIAGLLQPQA